jgi:hypothetical protein
MIAEARALASVPAELTSAEAAPLLCAGITTYNALRNVALRGGTNSSLSGWAEARKSWHHEYCNYKRRQTWLLGIWSRPVDGGGYMSDHTERKSVNSRRSFIVGVSDASVAAAPTETPFANGHAFFFATPPESRDSKREEQFDASVFHP